MLYIQQDFGAEHSRTVRVNLGHFHLESIRDLHCSVAV